MVKAKITLKAALKRINQLNIALESALESVGRVRELRVGDSTLIQNLRNALDEQNEKVSSLQVENNDLKQIRTNLLGELDSLISLYEKKHSELVKAEQDREKNYTCLSTVTQLLNDSQEKLCEANERSARWFGKWKVLLAELDIACQKRNFYRDNSKLWKEYAVRSARRHQNVWNGIVSVREAFGIFWRALCRWFGS